MGKKGTGFLPCTHCGGSGATTTYEYDKNGKKTIVRKICVKCGGRGGFHV